MYRPKKLITNYAYKRVDEISPFAHGAATAVSASTYIPNGEEAVKPLRNALAVLDEFTQMHAVLTPLLTSELVTLRRAVLSELSKLASGINADFAGNESALLSSGLELAADPVAKKPPLAPARCELVAGLQSGTMIGRTKRAKESVNVLWYYTTDPTLPLDKWTCVLCNADELTIPHQVPSTRLYLRVACLNSASDSSNLLFAEAKPRYVE